MCSVYNNHNRNKKRKFINEENNYVPPDSYPPEVECNNAAESNHTQKRKTRKLFNVNSKNYFGDDNILSCHEISTKASTASDSLNAVSSHVYKKNEYQSDHNSLGSFTEKVHKKHKKDRERNSTNGLGNGYAGQILSSPNNPCLDESLSDITSMNKHKDKGHNLVSTLDNLTDKDVDEISIIYEDQYSDGTLFAGSLRKKHRKEKSNYTSDIKDSDIGQILNCYELPYNNEVSDGSHKKYKKCKESKKNKLTGSCGSGNIDQVSNCHNVLCLNGPVPDSHVKKKHKEYKENSLVTTSDIFMNKTVNKTSDIYEEKCLDASFSANTSRKKHKTHKIISNCDNTVEDTDIAQVPNYVCYMGEPISNASHNQKHKRHKKSKDKNLANGVENEDYPISNSLNILYPSESVSNDQAKKKHRKYKENSLVTTFLEDSLKNKTVNEIVDINEEQYLDASFSAGTSKERPNNYKNVSSCSRAMKDTNIAQIPNCYEYELPNCDDAISDALYKKKHQKNKDGNLINGSQNVDVDPLSNCHNNLCLDESDSYVYSSTEKGNEFNPIFITDFDNPIFITDVDAEITDESHKNSFEVTQRVAKINERLRQRNPLVLDFTEDFLDFEVPPLHANECVRSLSKEKQNELLSQGVIEKTGKFTHDEDVIIMKNFEDFLKTYDSLDASELLGIGRQKTDHQILKFLKAKHFYVRLGKGLNDRSLSSIYKRARRLLHPNRSKNSFKETEVKSLKYLRKVVNRKWSYIADALERTEDNCTQAYRWHGKDISRGEWTKEEEEQLIAAIEKVTGSSDLSCGALKGISWDKVANHVPTRSFSQCRMHWAYHLAQKPGDLKQKWGKNCTKELVNILRKDWYVENASQIDWLKVYESFVDVAPSHIYVQRKWLYLRSKIAGFKTMSYKGIINALCKKYNITPQETHSAPFSSFARNQSILYNLEHMKEFTEDARNETNKDV